MTVVLLISFVDYYLFHDYGQVKDGPYYRVALLMRCLGLDYLFEHVVHHRSRHLGSMKVVILFYLFPLEGMARQKLSIVAEVFVSVVAQD